MDPDRHQQGRGHRGHRPGGVAGRTGPDRPQRGRGQNDRPEQRGHRDQAAQRPQPGPDQQAHARQGPAQCELGPDGVGRGDPGTRGLVQTESHHGDGRHHQEHAGGPVDPVSVVDHHGIPIVGTPSGRGTRGVGGRYARRAKERSIGAALSLGKRLRRHRPGRSRRRGRRGHRISRPAPAVFRSGASTIRPSRM